MEKKKAIKIATAAVIAAGAFTAVAPAQSEAATSLSSKVKTAKSTIKKPYSTYFNATKLASVATVEKQIAAAKTAKTKILKTIKDSTASKANKAKYTAEVNAYNKYITRAESYVKGYNAAAKAQAANNKIADKIVAAAADQNGAEVKKQYKALEAAVKKTDKAIKDTVYGAKIEALLYDQFTGATKAALAGDLKVANYGEKLQYWIAKGDFATAKKRYDYIDSKLANVTTEAIVKYAEAAKAQYDAAVAIEITSVDALDEANRYLQINFSTAAVAINASDIEIKDAKTGNKFGVKAVTLAADGKSAQVELFASEDDKSVLDENTEYTVTVTVNSKTVVGTFYDAAFIEGRVTDINVQDKEFTIVDDKDKETRTLKVQKDTDFDYQAALGDIVRVWFNDDNDLVKATIVKASTATEAVEVTKVDEVKVLSTGKKYDTSAEVYQDLKGPKFKFYLNGEDKTADFKAGKYIGAKVNFAKVGFDKSGDVEFVSAYQLNSFLIVDRVSGDEVVGIQGNGTNGSFDAEDATIVKEGKTIALTDLKKGDVLFLSESADNSDGYAEVLNKTVTGKIDTVYEKAVSVAGNTYKFIADKDVTDAFGGLQYSTAVYLDEDGKTDRLDSDAAEQLQAAGDVTIYTDYAGNVVYIAGGVAEVSKNEKTAILTDVVQPKVDYGKAKVQLEALVENNEEEVYDVTLQDLKTITVNGIDYDIENTNPDATEWSVGFDSNTNPTKIVLTPGVGNTGAVINLPFEAAGQLVKVVLNSNGNPTELQVFTGVGNKGGEDSLGGAVLEAGDAYFIGKNAGSKKLTSNTVVYDATKGSTVSYDAKDISITTWDKYSGGDILNATAIYNDDNEVEALVVSGKTTTDSVYEEAVITDVLRNTDKDIVQIDAFVNGTKQTLTVDKVSAAGLVKGDVAILEFDKNNNKLVQGIQENDKRGNEYNNRVITGQKVESVDVGDSSVTLNGKTYKLAAEGKVITVGDLNDIKVKNLSDLKGQTNVTVVLDENSGVFAKYFVYGVAGSATPLELAKAALSTAITAFNTVTEADYTPASYAAYKTAVDAAKAVQANATATQAQIEAATTAVTTAKTNLVVKTPTQTGEIKITSSTALAANDFALSLGAIDYTVAGTVANAPAGVTEVTLTFTNANPDAENPASKEVKAPVTNGSYTATILASEFETWTSVKASYTSNGVTVESNVATFAPAVK